MKVTLETLKARRKITVPARKAAKDLLQVADYIDGGKKTRAIYNMNQAINREQKILRELKKL